VPAIRLVSDSSIARSDFSSASKAFHQGPGNI
jgi:hypothetical protein